MLRVVNFVLGPLRNNTYLITDEETGAGLVVDPSFGSEQVAAYAAREQIHIDKILLTHGHNDHVAGVTHPSTQFLLHSEKKAARCSDESRAILSQNL